MYITEAQWADFFKNGFVKLGVTASAEEVAALNSRLEDIMQGRIQ